MLKTIIPVAISTFLTIAGLLPAGAQGATYDTRSLYRAGASPRFISIGKVGPSGAPTRSTSIGSNGAPGSQGNTTYKTGEGPSSSLNPASSNPTSNQRTGTLTVVSTAGLAPMIGVDAPGGGSGQGGVGGALGGAVGGAIGGALGGALGSAIGSNIGNAIASNGGQDMATATMGMEENSTAQLGGGSGF